MIGYPGFYCNVCQSWIPIISLEIPEVVECPQCGTVHVLAELEQEVEAF